MNTFVKSKTDILSPKGTLEAILGPKQDKHRHCVEVAAITRYQSSRRKQHVRGAVTFTSGSEQFESTSTKCLRRFTSHFSSS